MNARRPVFGPLGKLLVKFEISPREVMNFPAQKRNVPWSITSSHDATGVTD